MERERFPAAAVDPRADEPDIVGCDRLDAGDLGARAAGRDRRRDVRPCRAVPVREEDLAAEKAVGRLTGAPAAGPDVVGCGAVDRIEPDLRAAVRIAAVRAGIGAWRRYDVP